MSNPKFGAGRAAGLGVFSDHETDWAWKRALAYASEGAATIGECLAVARRIDEKDGETWIAEWAKLAIRLEEEGNASLSAGDPVSARSAFLRASNYFRTAEYGATPDHARFDELWGGSVRTFRAACPLFDRPIETIAVDFEGCRLPGYFCRATDSGTAPTIIVAGGNDSSLEEMALGVFAAVARGYNFFLFDHPGHRGAVHLYPQMTKRAEYHTAYAAAIDLLATLPGVDERLILVGYSYGGYVATQVATRERRLSAVVPNSPIVNGRQALGGGGFLKDLMQSVAQSPERDLETVIDEWFRGSPIMYALARYSCWSWGNSSFTQQLQSTLLDEHDLVPNLGEIHCPTLALVSADEGEELVRQAQVYIDGVSSTAKRLHTFTLDHDGSNDHCQIDNLSRFQQVFYGWLREVVPQGRKT